MNNIENIRDKDCAGCFACKSICPAKAISEKCDEIGNYYPCIDYSKCINCGKCLKVCNLRNSFYNKINYVFASVNKNNEEHLSSSSGGIATLISQKIINLNGIVYGVVSDRDGIHYKRIDSEQNLEILKGSKYVQPYDNNVYFDVLSDLKKDRIVLFIGLPCKVAGLLSFLGEKKEKLFTIDLICHEAVSQKILNDHLEYLNINKNDIEKVTFRNNDKYVLSVFGKDEDNNRKILYSRDDLHDFFYAIFEDGIGCRESCANCAFAQKKRVGDLTLGDFHGIRNKTDFFDKISGGVSLVLINSEKGFSLFDGIRKRTMSLEMTEEDALRSNPQLSYPLVQKVSFEQFKKSYKKYGYKKTVYKKLKIRLLKNWILSLLKKIHGENR